MTGPYESVIGMRVDKVLKRFLLQTPSSFEVAKRDVRLAGTLVDVDEATGKARGDRAAAGAGYARSERRPHFFASGQRTK